jgi:hypothetical protein
MPDPLFETFFTSRGLNSLRQKWYHILVKNWYWLFWCQWWSDYRDQEVFWGNWALEAVEASEVAEATEVNEAGEVSKAWRITTVDFRVSQVLEFNNFRANITLFWCFEKKRFGQNHENPCLILAPFLSEAIEAAWGQKSFKWLIRHKFPLLRKPLSISFW